MNRITQRGGQRRNRLMIGVTLAAAAIALIACEKPNEARAADGTTDVTVQVAEGDENLAWSVPTQIPMKATAGGTLIGPDADAIAIRNLSAFPIRVKQMDTTAEAPFNLVDDVDKSNGNNDVMMAVNGAAAKQTVELPDDGTWAMGYEGNEDGSDKLPITISSAKIARVTTDLSVAKKAATVTWTVEPTEYVKPDPKPNPNGVAFAVFSANDKSLNLYKRESKPEVGDTFNGKTVTELFDIDETKIVTPEPSQRDDYPFGSISSYSEKIEVVDSGIRPASTAYWFAECSYASSADVVKLDTSADYDMRYMFCDCCGLTDLDISSWDTSSVTNMSKMFINCNNLASLDLSGWDVSNVTNMYAMFEFCVNLTDLDISGWDTSSVTNMREMFRESTGLTSLDLSDWDVSSVTDIRGTFYCCSGLTTVGDLSGWNVSSVTNMRDTFSCPFGGSSLTTVGDLSGWDVSNVDDMSGMFKGCSGVTTVGNLSSWNTSSVTAMDDMFSGCSGLTTVGDLSGWDVSNVTALSSMFEGCSGLTTVGDLTGWNTSSVKYIECMFKGCSSLTVDCSNWDVSAIHNAFQYEDFNESAPGVTAPNWNK